MAVEWGAKLAAGESRGMRLWEGTDRDGRREEVWDEDSATAGQMRMKLGSDVLVPFSWSHYAASFNIHATGGFLGTREAV